MTSTAESNFEVEQPILNSAFENPTRLLVPARPRDARACVAPFKTSAGQLFLDRYTDLLELSWSQQIAMRQILAAYLQRVEYDETNLPFEFFPFERSPQNAGQRLIVISPFVSFGRPILRRTGVSTRAVAQRIDAGEDIGAVLEDYNLTESELGEALLFEAAA